MFDHRGQCGSHDHSREHGLIEVANQFLERKSNCGDGRVEGRRNACRHAHRRHSAPILRAEPGCPRQHAAHARADMYRGALDAQRCAGAELNHAEHKLADRLFERDEAEAPEVCNFDLGNAAAGCRGSPISQPNPGNRASHRRGENRQPDPRMPRRSSGRFDPQSLKAPRSNVEGNRRQAAQPAREYRERQ